MNARHEIDGRTVGQEQQTLHAEHGSREHCHERHGDKYDGIVAQFLAHTWWIPWQQRQVFTVVDHAMVERIISHVHGKQQANDTVAYEKKEIGVVFEANAIVGERAMMAHHCNTVAASATMVFLWRFDAVAFQAKNTIVFAS